MVLLERIYAFDDAKGMMNVHFINSFIIGVEDIFTQVVGGLTIERKSPYVRKSLVPTDNILCSIGLTGDIAGNVIFAFDKDFALDLVQEMCGLAMSEPDDMVLSALGEISNMVSGRATIKLDELGQSRVNITSPKILYAAEQVKADTPILCIPFNNGNKIGLEVNLALQG